jgi:alpha-glucoside transport system substrate-binding protein
LSLLATACLGGDDSSSSGGGGDGDGTEGTNGGSGGTINVLGALIDQDADDFLASAVEPFEEETGITVEYEGSGDFETLARTRVEGGNPPDVMLFPQPGLMADLARSGDLRDLEGIVDVEALRESLVAGLFANGVVDSTLVGVPYRLNYKSMVWYPVPEFEDDGYTVPETWEDMVALSQQIVDDGKTPWCIGMESSGATGWVATDWIEDIMLRTAGADKYDQWVTGELRFDSPEVTAAVEELGKIWFADGFVKGGTTAIVTTPFGDSPNGLFDDPPSCYMHRQASFITGFFPEDVELGTDVDFFPFPAMPSVGDAQIDGNPALVAGDLAVLLTDNPAAEEFMKWLADPAAGEAWAESGSFLSPHGDFDTSLYPTDIVRRQGELIAEAPFSKFDGSDLMPGAVGAGQFWAAMTEYVNSGGEGLQEALTSIDEAWPEDLRGKGVGTGAEDVGGGGGGAEATEG